MSIQAPRRVKSQNTRRKIFNAAADLLKNHGEDYLTIANICEKAGVSKGTFFYHFNSKEDLMLYYLQEGFDDFVAEQDASPHDENDIYQLVLSLYRNYLNYCENAGLDFISSYYSSKNKALNARDVMATEETMTSLLRMCVKGTIRAQEEGFVRKDWTAQDISYDCCSVIKGCVFEWCLSDGTIDLLAHSEHMLYIYFQSVVTDKYHSTYPHNEPPMA